MPDAAVPVAAEPPSGARYAPDEARRSAAARQLEQLARCRGVTRFQAGDEEQIICGSCFTPVIHAAGRWQHDQDAVRDLRLAAGWPR